MAEVVTEKMLLLIPTFIALMIFVLVANRITSVYGEQQRLITIKGAENQFISTVQQLYQILVLEEIQPCTVTKTNPLPSTINSEPYLVTGYITEDTLTLTFTFPGIDLHHDVFFMLGPKLGKCEGTLDSLKNPIIKITKERSGNDYLISIDLEG